LKTLAFGESIISISELFQRPTTLCEKNFLLSLIALLVTICLFRYLLNVAGVMQPKLEQAYCS